MRLDKSGWNNLLGVTSLHGIHDDDDVWRRESEGNGLNVSFFHHGMLASGHVSSHLEEGWCLC